MAMMPNSPLSDVIGSDLPTVVPVCGATSKVYGRLIVCDKQPDHRGEHRAYWEFGPVEMTARWGEV